MLEKRLNKENFKTLGYVLGIILEFIGFALLFGKDNFINFLQRSSFLISILIIFSGYVLAVAVRRFK